MAVSAFKELGSIGRSSWGESIHFQETDATLRGLNGVRFYDEMRRTDHTGMAMHLVLSLPIRQVGWRAEPATKADADQKAADFLWNCLGDMSTTFADVLSDALSFFPYGWAWLEMVMKRRDDGLVGFKKIALRPQATLADWVYSPDGDILSMKQYTGDGDTVEIPLKRSLLFRTTREGDDPEGLSVYRAAVRAYKYRKRMEQVEGIGLYRRWAGFPMVTLPAGATTIEAEGQASDEYKAEQLVKAIYQDRMMGAYLPDGWEVSLGGPEGNIDTTMGETIIRKDAEMARAILAQFLMLGLKEVGTNALAVTLLDAFYMAVEAFLVMIKDLLNLYAVPYLFTWYIDTGMTGLPTLEHSNPRTLDLKAVGAYISSLARNELLTGDARTEDFLRSLVPGMPPAADPETGEAIGAEDPEGRDEEIESPSDEEETEDKPPPDDEGDEMSRWVRVPKVRGETALYRLGADKLPASSRSGAYNQAANNNRVTQRENMAAWADEVERRLTDFGTDVEEHQLRDRLLELVMIGLAVFRDQSVLDIAAAFWLGFGSQSGGQDELRALSEEIDLADAWIGHGRDGRLVEINPAGSPTLFGDIRGTLEGKLLAILLLLRSGKRDEAMMEVRDAIRTSTRAFSRFEQYSGHVWRAVWRGASLSVDANWPVRWVLDAWADHCATCPLFEGEYPHMAALLAYTGGVLPGHGTECDGWCRCAIEVLNMEVGLWETM